jgi:chemotaxis protein MotB
VAKKGVFEVDVSPPAASADPNMQEPSNQNPEFENPANNNDASELQRRYEEEQFREAERELRSAIQEIPHLKTLAKSLLIDNTPEGLRVQIVDQDGLPMFPRGGADMHLHTRKMLELVAKVILEMPQSVALAGHTDATKFQSDSGYSNWELSADRANAARRTLIEFGVPEDRIARVVGRAATDPLLPHDPEAPGNRRLTMVLLRGTGTQQETTNTNH